MNGINEDIVKYEFELEASRSSQRCLCNLIEKWWKFYNCKSVTSLKWKYHLFNIFNLSKDLSIFQYIFNKMELMLIEYKQQKFITWNLDIIHDGK